MKKLFTIGLLGLLLTTSFTTIDSKKHSESKHEDELKVVYLDDEETEYGLEKASLTEEETPLNLSSSNDAYVLNKKNFNRLESSSANKFLEEGGVIAVTDNKVTSELLKEKIETDVLDFNYSNREEMQGFYLYNDGNKNVTVNVSVGFLTVEDQADVTSASVHEETSNIIDKDAVTSQMILSAIRLGDFEYNTDVPGGGGSDNSTIVNESFDATLQNMLFEEGNPSNYMCSYKITTEVRRGIKYHGSSGHINGVYDINSVFHLDAEANYQVTKYKVRMSSPQTIMDASYLNSNTTSSVTVGGTIGFQGDELTGGINAGYTYEYNTNSQEILNNLPVGPNQYWQAEVVKPELDATWRLDPAIRIKNENDSTLSSESSRVEEFYIRNNGFWFWAKEYYMLPKYRKELKLIWDSNGRYTQETITG